MEDAIAQPLKRAIAARVYCPPLRVIAAIHFDDQAGGGSAEISDVAANDDLATERHAQTAAAPPLGVFSKDSARLSTVCLAAGLRW